MFEIRTSPVEYGTKPYVWDIPSVYQCVWYVFYRILECGFSPVEWWDRATKTGSYTNAKDWLENYRDPWIPITDLNYQPVAGDVAVFTGQYGHVQFFETDTMVSEYSSGDPNSFRCKKFVRTDNLIGFLHYPYEPVETVERNENVDQIECTDNTLRIRDNPSLNGQIVGHVQIGFYNVLNTAKADGYTWYEIAKDRWCADITTKYLPKSESDMVEQIKKWADNMVSTIKEKDKKIADLTADMSKIEEISSRWKTQ